MKDFYIFDELSEHITIKINSCQEDFHDGSWIESKSHNDYDLWYVLCGQIHIEINSLTSTANEGDAIFFYPSNRYTAYTNSDGCRFIYVHFDFGMGNNYRILDDFNLAGIIPASLISEQALSFQKGFHEFQKKTTLSSLLFKGCFITFLSALFQICIRGNARTTFYTDIQNRNKVGKLTVLQPVLDYINQHTHKPLRISELSSVASMSEKYFSNYFKKALGISPAQYIFQLKMNKARNYLYQKKYTIKEIATFLGYPDQYTFSKAFKKYYNVPPSKFK